MDFIRKKYLCYQNSEDEGGEKPRLLLADYDVEEQANHRSERIGGKKGGKKGKNDSFSLKVTDKK